MPENPNIENNCDTDGILPSVAGVMGSFQASEVIKSILHTKDNFSGKMLIVDILNLNFRKTRIAVNSKCKNKCKR